VLEFDAQCHALSTNPTIPTTRNENSLLCVLLKKQKKQQHRRKKEKRKNLFSPTCNLESIESLDFFFYETKEIDRLRIVQRGASEQESDA
jgi:hypothetical protein